MNFCNLRTILQVRVACFTFKRRNAARTGKERKAERREKEGQARKRRRDTKSIRVICALCVPAGGSIPRKSASISRARSPGTDSRKRIFIALSYRRMGKASNGAREREFFTPPDVTRRLDGVPLFFDFLRRFPPRPSLFSLSLSRPFPRSLVVFFPVTMSPSAFLLILLLLLLAA